MGWVWPNDQSSIDASKQGSTVTLPCVEVPESPRLRFRPMSDGDLDLMHSLLGDPTVMTHYDHPKSPDECRAWINWNRRNYARDGFGLWIIETTDGDFVGDCGFDLAADRR